MDEKMKETAAPAEKKQDEVLAESEGGATDELSKKDKKREEKHYKDENKKLTAEAEALKAELEKAKADLAETTDKYMRCAAEYDNFRRRSVKEREGVFADAYADALSSVLPIMDNLERAAAYSDGAQLADGIKLIFKSADEAFERMGVIKFGEAGETFDPQIHNAMMHVEDETLGENVIAEVFQKGYRKGDRILREALVKVAN